MDVAKVNAAALASVQALAPDLKRISLHSLWRRQTTIFVFLRHFGSAACRAHATEVWSKREAYEKQGARIVFIGNGDPCHIENFKQEIGIEDALVLTDPSLQCFRAAGFRRGFLASHGPASLHNALKLTIKGYRQSRKNRPIRGGDRWQLGGVLVLSPEGRIKYHYISESNGDFPADEETYGLQEPLEPMTSESDTEIEPLINYSIR